MPLTGMTLTPVSALGKARSTSAGFKTFLKLWAVVILRGSDVASGDTFTR